MVRNLTLLCCPVFLLIRPVAFAADNPTAQIRAAAESASDKLSSCVVKDVQDQLFGKKRSATGIDSGCYAAVFLELKTMVDSKEGKLDPSISSDCALRVSHDIRKFEAALVATLAVESQTGRVTSLRRLLDDVKSGFNDTLAFCEKNRRTDRQCEAELGLMDSARLICRKIKA